MGYKFQFPTGWNSTYTAGTGFSGSIDCFNSQRDGILLLGIFLAISKIKVSIPNGMEFYTAAKALATLLLSFNSQRDGILLVIQKVIHFLRKVSIPNGMEFYCALALSPPRLA